jgi:hypothetical protein
VVEQIESFFDRCNLTSAIFTKFVEELNPANNEA